MGRTRVLGPRGLIRSFGSAAPLAAVVLASCGPAPTQPATDRFQPTRPTTKGSMADAVREAHERSTSGPPKPVRQIVGVPGEPVSPVQLFEPEPAPDAATTRQHVLDYLAAMGVLLEELEAISSGARGESLPSVAAKCDAVRARLDQLVSMPPESRQTLDAELGGRIDQVRSRADELVASLATDEARRPIATLVADLRLLD